MYSVKLPVWIDVSKKKRFYLNLNQYRNTHFTVLNTAKIKFKESIQKELDKLPILVPPVAILYIVYPKIAGAFGNKMDVANVGSVVDKFFSDALVESGKLPSDDHENIPEIGYRFGSIDWKNPRVEAEIYSLS